MNQIFIKIILIFFLFAALFPCRLSADASIAPGLMLRNDVSGYDLQYLKSIVRQLDRYAKMANIRRLEADITIIHSKSDYIGIYNGRYLYLPGDANQWQEDFALRRKIYAALASCRFGFSLPTDTPGVAEWIACGLDAELETAASSGQFLLANRGFPLLIELSGYCGTLPDYAVMSRIGRSPFPVLQEFLAEQSRMLLLILADNGKIADVFEKTANGQAPDCFTDYYASPEKAGNELAKETEKRLWNRYNPMPAELAMIRLQELDIIFVQKVDEQGNPSGEYMECNWQTLAKMLRSPRQDAAALRQDLADKFTELGKLLPNDERQHCNHIASAARKLGNNEADNQFSHHLELLKTTLNRRKHTDRFLRDTLARFTPVPDNFFRLFFAAKILNSSCTADEIKFLQQILNNYMR